MNNKIVWLALLFLVAGLVIMSACDNGPDEADPIGSCDKCPSEDDDSGDDDSADDDSTDDDDDAVDYDEVVVTGTSGSAGTALLAVYDGESWDSPDIPYITTNDGAMVLDISLNSATTGYAVVGNTRTQIFELTATKGWDFVQFSTADLDWTLNGISSPSANLTVAVGYTMHKEPDKPLVMEYSGTSWAKAVITEDNEAHLKDVAALSTGETWAVGNDNSGGPKVYSRASTGAWTEETDLSTFADELNAVVAVATDNVYAAGNNSDDILHYNGTDWSVMTITTDKADVNWVDGDTDGTDLTLVGSDGTTGVIAVYDGTWELFNPDLGLDSWYAMKVEMLATDDIYVAGEGVDSSKAGVSIIAHYNGSDWDLVDLSSTSLTDELVSAVDFFDGTNSYFGGANFLLPFDGSTFSAEILPEIPVSYTLTAAIADDTGITSVGYYDGAGLIVEGTTKAFTLNMITDAKSFRSITSSALGTFAAADINAGDETIYEKDGSDWTAVDTSTLAPGASFKYLDSTDDMLIAVSDDVILTYDGTDWAELTTPDLSPLTDTVFHQAAVDDGEIWVAGEGQNSGDMEGFVVHEDGEEKAWTVIEFEITDEFTFTTIASSGYVFFGGYKLDGGLMVPISYKITADDPIELAFPYTATLDMWFTGVATDTFRSFGVATETTEAYTDAVVMVAGTDSWTEMAGTGFLADTQPEGIFYRVGTTEAPPEE